MASPRVRPVRRVASITPADFHRTHNLPRIPLIVQNGAAAWPARRKWTWSWLRKEHGRTLIVTLDAKANRWEMRLSRFLDYLLAPQRFRVEDGPLYAASLGTRRFPRLLDDYEKPSFVEDWFDEFPPGIAPAFSWLFLGPDGSGTGLHKDTSGTHAWLTQIYGRKEWRLYAPDSIPDEYCDGADAFQPDLSRFPALATEPCFTAELGPGETIFVPYPWRHQVRNIGPNWAVSENYVNASNAEDVFQFTRFPELRPALTDRVVHQARQILNGPSGGSIMRERVLLCDYVERRLGNGHADPELRGVREALRGAGPGDADRVEKR